jgi:hypothetical protein
MMGAPFAAGAVKSTMALAFQEVMVLMTGIPGALYIGITGFESDRGEFPAGVPATNEMLYETSLVNPVMVTGDIVVFKFTSVVPPSMV